MLNGWPKADVILPLSLPFALAATGARRSSSSTYMGKYQQLSQKHTLQHHYSGLTSSLFAGSLLVMALLLLHPTLLLSGEARVRLSALVVFSVTSLECRGMMTDSSLYRLAERFESEEGAGDEEKNDSVSEIAIRKDGVSQ